MESIPNEGNTLAACPDTADARTSSRAMTARLLAILLIALVCFGIHNDWPGHERSDELFYLTWGLSAEKTGDYLIPSYHGKERLQKPPLNYWLVALSYKFFGKGLWQGRLPSVLAGVASVALTWWLGLLLFQNRRVALYGAAALASCYVMITRTHTAHTDMVLGCLILGSFCGFAAACRRGAWWNAVILWMFLGGATMQKGPVGFLVPFCTMLAWLFFFGRKNGVPWSRLFSPAGIALFLAIVLPWPLLVFVNERVRGSDVLDTVSAEIKFHLIPGHVESPGTSNALTGIVYFVIGVFERIFPWSLLLMFFVKRPTRTPMVWLLILWGVGTALVFGVIMALHRTRYLIPMMPAFAVLSAYALAELQRGAMHRSLVGRVFSWATDITLAAGAFMAALMVAGTRLSFVDPGLSVALAAITFIISAGSIWVVRWLRRRDPTGPDWVTAAACSMCVLITLTICMWKQVLPINPMYEIARRNLRQQPESTRITAVGLRLADVSWAWLGAGRVFDECPDSNNPQSLKALEKELPSYDFVLCDSGTADRFSQSLFRVVDALDGSDTEFSIIWPLRSVQDATARWQKNERKIVLLKRLLPRAVARNDAMAK